MDRDGKSELERDKDWVRNKEGHNRDRIKWWKEGDSDRERGGAR